jgi:hypothetical protein
MTIIRVPKIDDVVVIGLAAIGVRRRIQVQNIQCGLIKLVGTKNVLLATTCQRLVRVRRVWLIEQRRRATPGAEVEELVLPHGKTEGRAELVLMTGRSFLHQAAHSS